MNIISRCQTHFCLIPGGYDDKKYNIYITISSSRWGWRSTRLHKISLMLVTPTVFCGTRSSSLFHHRVLLTRSPQCLFAFLLTETSSCYQKVICWLEASFFSNNWEWVWTHISDGLRINFGLQTYQMDAYDHPRINFPSLDINRISFVTRAITNLSSTHWYIFYFGS